MNFIDLPVDILLRAFELLSIPDLLALEQACTTLRSVMATRHLWLVKLRMLDQHCASDLPPYIDVGSLSYSELRSAVTRPIRWNKACKRGLATSQETLIGSARLDIRQDFPTDMEHWHAKLAPGGKHLVVEKNGFKVLSVKTGACVCQWDHSAHRSSNFALEALSEWTLLVFHTFPNLANGSFILDLFQVDQLSEEAADVRRIATTQTPDRSDFFRNYMASFTVLGNGFCVTSIRQGSIKALVIWSWQSGELIEVTIGTLIFPKAMQIANGWLFCVLADAEDRRHFTLHAICLRELSFTSTTMDFADIQKWSTDIHFPDGPHRASDFLNLAISLFSNTTQIYAAAVARIPGNRRTNHVVVNRFTFNTGDTSNVCDTNDSAFNLVSLSYQPVPRSGENTMLYLSVCTEATAHRSGLFVIKAKEVSMTETSAGRYLWLVGMDEGGDIFLSCLYRSRRSVPSRLLLDEYSGAMIRLVLRDGVVHVRTHYVP